MKEDINKKKKKERIRQKNKNIQKKNVKKERTILTKRLFVIGRYLLLYIHVSHSERL